MAPLLFYTYSLLLRKQVSIFVYTLVMSSGFRLIVLFALVVSLFASCGRNTKKNADIKGASIQLDSTFARLGTFPKSQSLRTTVFTFTNVGDEPLEFLDMDVSCGCVSATYPEKPVKPGKKGEIVVTYRGRNTKPGKVYQKLYFEVSGDPAIFTLRVGGVMTEN